MEIRNGKIGLTKECSFFSACLVTNVRWASYAVHPLGPALLLILDLFCRILVFIYL